MRVYADNSLSIGRTPLVRLRKVVPEGATVLAKIEGRNPAFSVKCRIGAAMVWDAEQQGRLTPGMTLVEATSGNTGIALAFVCAARGYRLKLTMPATMSLERRKLLKALGAELVLTEGARGMQGAVDVAEAMVREHSETHLMLQQFENPANPRIHESTTGPEIWEDTDGTVDVLVSGVGTGGTLTGVSRFIKKTCGRALTTVAVEPAASPLIGQYLKGEALKPAGHKIQGIGANFIPTNLDISLIDRVEPVTNEEAYLYARRLMQEEGILAGISCGAATCAAAKIAALPEFYGKTIAVILPDSAERYLSTPLFEGMFGDLENKQ